LLQVVNFKCIINNGLPINGAKRCDSLVQFVFWRSLLFEWPAGAVIYYNLYKKLVEMSTFKMFSPMSNNNNNDKRCNICLYFNVYRVRLIFSKTRSRRTSAGRRWSTTETSAWLCTFRFRPRARVKERALDGDNPAVVWQIIN